MPRVVSSGGICGLCDRCESEIDMHKLHKGYFEDFISFGICTRCIEELETVRMMDEKEVNPTEALADIADELELKAAAYPKHSHWLKIYAEDIRKALTAGKDK